MKRYLHTHIDSDLKSKIVLLTGPRQCGKTTLSKMVDDNHQYLSYDFVEHRMILNEKSWERDKSLIIFDELHKMDNWKSWLKGIYDVEGIPPAILVTGSARLSAFRKVGDSLAGRHFTYRMHPIDMKEASEYLDLSTDEVFERLMTVGGFPEPFLNGSTTFYNRWKRSHIDSILKEDLLALTNVRDVQSIETLIEMLRYRIGSSVSSNSLARDLQKSPNTIQNWLKILEDLYIIFKVRPYHRNIARAILKEPKYYFYDSAMVVGDDGLKLENLVACALLKETEYSNDVLGNDYSMNFIKNKEGQEVDFLITKNKQPYQFIEVKWADESLSPNLKKFLPDSDLQRIQIVGSIKQNKSFPTGERIVCAKSFLTSYQLD